MVIIVTGNAIRNALEGIECILRFTVGEDVMVMVMGVHI